MEKLRLDFCLSVGGELSAGDEIIDSCGCSHIINERTVDYWTERDKSDKDRFITSFAERKNKGEQPGHDDFPVIVFVSGGNCSASVASMEEWMHCGRQSIQSWKPDYEALLKMQAEHDKHNESIIKACDEVNKKTQQTSAEKTLNMLGYRDLGGELWKPPLGEPHVFEKESEWVYTQEMKDDDCQLMAGLKYLDENGQLCEFVGYCCGLFIGHLFEAPPLGGRPMLSASRIANPYKTPEQIKLEEAKKEQLEDMRFKYKNLPLEVAMQMQENGDLPEIVLDDLSARGMAKQ